MLKKSIIISRLTIFSINSFAATEIKSNNSLKIIDKKYQELKKFENSLDIKNSYLMKYEFDLNKKEKELKEFEKELTKREVFLDKNYEKIKANKYEYLDALRTMKKANYIENLEDKLEEQKILISFEEEKLKEHEEKISKLIKEMEKSRSLFELEKQKVINEKNEITFLREKLLLKDRKLQKQLNNINGLNTKTVEQPKEKQKLIMIN